MASNMEEAMTSVVSVAVFGLVPQPPVVGRSSHDLRNGEPFDFRQLISLSRPITEMKVTKEELARIRNGLGEIGTAARRWA